MSMAKKINLIIKSGTNPLIHSAAQILSHCHKKVSSIIYPVSLNLAINFVMVTLV